MKGGYRDKFPLVLDWAAWHQLTLELDPRQLGVLVNLVVWARYWDRRVFSRTLLRSCRVGDRSIAKFLELGLLVERADGEFDLCCDAFDWPAEKKPKRRPLSNSLRWRVLERDLFACAYCGRMPPEVILHVDHIKPVSKGGTDDLENLVAACSDCNFGKRDRYGDA